MNLRVSTAPQIRQGVTTQRLMGHVLMALIPCVIAGVYRFGMPAALLLVVAMLSAVLAELLFQIITKREATVNDLSALVTGLILGLNLPPTAPWWIAMIGSAFAVVIVKQLFGGIGDNFMNPAMAARAVLLASWPVHMTNFIQPLNQPLNGPGAGLAADAVTAATPLVSPGTSYWDLFAGNIAGSIGEVSKLMILLGLLYLLIAKVISWRIPVLMVGSAALMTLALGGDAVSAMLSGGLLFGAVFMATDYTTSPMTAKGQAVYAIGAGLIVAILRRFSNYPEGVTYAILLMNIATPLIDKYMRPKVYGHAKKEKEVQANA